MIDSSGACGGSEIPLIRAASPSSTASEAEPRWNHGFPGVSWSRISQGKVDAAGRDVWAAFSKQLLRNANHQPARRGKSGDTAGKKRTRPLAQYTANGLASPGH